MKKNILIFLFLIMLPLYAQKHDLRFAWLSDTHVGSKNAAQDLSNSVRDINSMDGIEFVILSGDVTQSGRTIDLKLAKSILDSLKVPYHIIPGNHDTKWSESGATVFPKLWGNDRFVFESNGFLFIGLHEGPIMRMADGHFSPEDLRWLDGVIANLKDKDKPVIFVTHYPLDDQIDNWFELITRLKKVNIQLVLVGHGHANRKLNFEGIPGIMGRSNIRAGKPAGGYNIVEIINDSAFFSERIPQTETKPVWAKLAISYPRPEFSINLKYSEVVEKWRIETNYVIASAPVVWNNNLVISGNSKGALSGYSLKNGSLKWTFKTGSAIYSSPDCADNRVVFASTDGNIYCLNPTNGKLLWKFPTENPIVAAPKIDKGIVYIGSSEGKFRAISLTTGKLIWSFEGVGEFVESRPLIYSGKAIFGAWDSYLYALNAKDGTLKWKWSNGNSEALYSPAACWPVASDGKVFIVAPDRYMTAIDAENGKTIWRTNKHLVRECIGISEDMNLIHTRTMTDTVLAISSKSDKPEVVWLRNANFGYDIDPSMTMEKDGTAFFGTKNGFVYALDAKTGETKWVHRTGTGLVNTVCPLNGNSVVISNMDGSIMVLERKSK